MEWPGHMAVTFLFGIQGAPGRAAGSFQGNNSMIFAILQCVLAGFPLASGGPTVSKLMKNSMERYASFSFVRLG